MYGGRYVDLRQSLKAQAALNLLCSKAGLELLPPPPKCWGHRLPLPKQRATFLETMKKKNPTNYHSLEHPKEITKWRVVSWKKQNKNNKETIKTKE